MDMEWSEPTLSAQRLVREILRSEDPSMSDEDAYTEFKKFRRMSSFKNWSTSEDRKGADGTLATFQDSRYIGVPAAKVEEFVDMIDLCGQAAHGHGRGNERKWASLAASFRLSAVYTKIKSAVRTVVVTDELGACEGAAAAEAT